MKVKPAPGRAVRDPHTMALLPEEGREVKADVFWLRRVRDGDVVVEQTPAPQRGRPQQHEPAREA